MRAVRFTFLVVLLTATRAPADWRPLTTDLLAREKTGFGGLCGVVVERSSGRLFVNLSDRGLFTSADRGATWTRVENSPLKGRTETPGCLQLDPTGKSPRLLMPLVYNDAGIALGTAGAGPWRTLDKVSRHVDWCAADWTDPEMKFLLTLKHEANGLLLRSRDGGKTFTELGKGYGPAWVFDATTAVVAKMKSKDSKGGVVRTPDGGDTFTPVAEFTPTALPRPGADGVYWLADGALHKTSDAGKTWAKLGAVKDGRYGPVFGKDAKQLFVLTSAGVVESTDGGAAWSAPVPLPKELKGVNALTWLDYDPTADTLYVMKMGSELYALRRGE